MNDLAASYGRTAVVLVCAVFAGLVTVLGFAGYGFAFGKSQIWCSAPAQLYCEAVLIALVILASLAPGSLGVMIWLRGKTDRAANVARFAPIAASGIGTAGTAAVHFVRCSPIHISTVLLEDAASVFFFVAVLGPLLMLYSAYRAGYAVWEDRDGRRSP